MDPREPFYRVRAWAGGWGVYEGERDELVTAEPLRTMTDAVIHAKELARRAGGAQLLVYDDGGRLVSELFYGPDERPALEDDDRVASLAASRPDTRSATRPPR
jgi:hypothetical protein